MSHEAVLTGWRRTWHEIIFESDTPAGRAFDLLLIFSILASFGLVVLESVASIEAGYGWLLRAGEWLFTILFTIEYVMRLACVLRPWNYATSALGLIDLLAVLPTYLAVLLPGAHVLISLRILRLLRIFRILKLGHYLSEAAVLQRALAASKPKIIVFLLTVSALVTIIGSVMYVIEGPEHGFTNIPVSIYWAIVTMTTVGFGDITPKTPLGQLFAGMVMILGYGIIAVPTGIVTSEMTRQAKKADEKVSSQCCMACAAEGHDADAKFCKYCGAAL
ncbi:MAG TPA: ion transporter [Candidatus Ozemobacteraceae bacterium]|nr:ion transporter [Candidatus Ozemobacteraceae bacterium]